MIKKLLLILTLVLCGYTGLSEIVIGRVTNTQDWTGFSGTGPMTNNGWVFGSIAPRSSTSFKTATPAARFFSTETVPTNNYIQSPLITNGMYTFSSWIRTLNQFCTLPPPIFQVSYDGISWSNCFTFPALSTLTATYVQFTVTNPILGSFYFRLREPDPFLTVDGGSALNAYYFDDMKWTSYEDITPPPVGLDAYYAGNTLLSFVNIGASKVWPLSAP